MKFYKLKIILIFLVLTSCSTLDKEGIELPSFIDVQTYIGHDKDSDSLYFYSVFINQDDDDDEKAFNFFYMLKSIEVILDGNDEQQIRFKFDKDELELFGIPSEIEKNKIVLVVNKQIFDELSSNINQVGIKLSHKNGMYIAKHPITTINQPLTIYPVILKETQSELESGILAIRNKIIDEYIPNSEILRTEITNYKGKAVYQSQEGGNFLQVINPVYPEYVSRTFLYKNYWNYKDNNGNKITTGEYQIKMMIPAVPNPYYSNMNFEMK